MSHKSKHNKTLQQQGDVLWFSTDKLPEGLKPVKSKIPGKIVFAEGETSGHWHGVAEETGVQLFEDEKGTLFCRVPGDVEVEHQEHKKVTLKKGDYRIGIVREVDPFAEEVRKVRD